MKEASTFNDTRFAVVVNTSTPPEFQDEDAPRIDYLELADALGAEIITPNPSLGTSRIGRLGSYLSATWNAFRRRNEYDVVLTMSEQVTQNVISFVRMRWIFRQNDAQNCVLQKRTRNPIT